MKINKRRAGLAIVFIAVLQIFLLMLMTYSAKQTLYDELSNRLYSGNSVVLTDEQDADWIDLDMGKDYRLFVEFSPAYRVLIKNNSTWAPPMISGYFPSGDESELKAVIGKNMLDYTFEFGGGEKYIKFGEQNFKVTGVLGVDYATSCDDLAILFGMSFMPGDLRSADIILDADNEKTISNVKNAIIRDHPSVSAAYNSVKGSARLTKTSYFYKLLAIEAILLVAFSLLAFMRYRYESKKTTRYVYYLMGLSINKVVAKELISIIALNLLSTIAVALVVILLNLIELPQLKCLVLISMAVLLFSCLSLVLFFMMDSVNRGNLLGNAGRKQNAIT
jgi:hypothetical protein